MGKRVDHECDEPCQLSNQFIKQITKDFDEALILGRGTFGTVYKGICENGEEIAVKVLKNTSGIDNMEFQKEFENLRRLKHQNVVELVGFCNEAEKVLVEYEGNQVVADKMHTALCFQYVQNGSLAKYISADGCPGINWHTQYKIIKGICQGIEYLRHGLEFSVWHLDLKPGNILLDNNMIPKIADFGLSRLLGDENTRKTINSVGTNGYLPPEYIECGLITKEFDIFSLGVIIAKLMAGREDYFKIDDLTEKRFIKKVNDNWRKRLCTIMKSRQLDVYCEQVKTCIQLALKCMKRKRQERPTIQSIVSNLIETEILIGDLALQPEQFRDGDSILPGASIFQARPTGMVADASRGEIVEVKVVTASAELKELPLQLLKKITNDFSDDRILSNGTLGTLYKGILVDGEVIAVKKLAERSPVPHDISLINEIGHITALAHENVAKLVGFCRELDEKVVENNGSYTIADIIESLLCYEYLPKGSLEKNLFEVPSKMNWETRYKIIKGTCQGLCSLHENQIVHMDLKPANILLDNDMQPKISDFSLSRFFEQTRLCTQTVVGTYGYLAPEFLYRGEISPQSDIYSLGILILETSTGEKNIRESDQPSSRGFIENVRENWTVGHMASKYSSLDADGLQQVEACIKIGLECVDIDRRKRPSIEKIVNMLNGSPWLSSDSLLSLHPQQINFPIGPKRLSSISLYLINNTEDRIAFRLATNCKLPRRYITELPFCGIVPPKCTFTVTVIKREQRKVPPPNSDDFLILQSSITHHEELDPASVAMLLDTAGDEVQEAKVVAASEPLADIMSNQIIDGQNYREVLSVDVHPTEPWILTSNQKGYVCIWNYQTQAQVDSIEVTREPVYSAKFIEREEWFVVGSGDGCIYVYNYNTFDEVDIIEAHDSHRITCLAVNPTYSFVLSASDDHTIKCWDWNNEWQCTRTFEGHYDTVRQVMFDPRNSESFASASLDYTVKIWNIHSATCNVTWDGHPDGLLCVHYHPRYFKQFLVSGSSDGAAKIWDLETLSCVDTLQGHAEDLSALCWHPELRVLVTGSLDGTVRIWNWKSTSSTYRLENIIGFNLGAVNALGYLKGSTRIVVGSDQGIALMDIKVL